MDSKKVRNWLGTLNNPVVETREFLEGFYKMSKAKYVVGQLEKGAEGTRHIQYFVNFPEPRRLAALKKICKLSHFEAVQINNGAHTYCQKEETRLEGPYEFGIKPIQRANKADWEEVKRNAQEGNWDKIPADIYIKYYGNLKRIHGESLKINDSDECRGIWLWGPPGTGKTTFARTEYSDDIYIKAQNKWWDGYHGQDTVILDDLDTPVLGHYLKIWADKWGASGEVKGGTVALVYKRFIVTSNYSIEELFQGKDEQLLQAIRRRFKVTHFASLQKGE